MSIKKLRKVGFNNIYQWRLSYQDVHNNVHVFKSDLAIIYPFTELLQPYHILMPDLAIPCLSQKLERIYDVIKLCSQHNFYLYPDQKNFDLIPLEIAELKNVILPLKENYLKSKNLKQL